MHYIRFLKPPSLSRPSKVAQDIQLTAKITITSDLGESFLCVDLPLVVILVDHDGHSFQTQPYDWKAGNRQLEISLRIAKASQDTKAALRWPFQVLIQPRDAKHYPHAMANMLNPKKVSSEPIGQVLAVLSQELHRNPSGTIDRRVQRRIKLHNGHDLCIWEETGESIARHIWQGASSTPF